MIRSVQDDHGNAQRAAKGIMKAFTIFLRRKYEPIAVEGEYVAYMTERMDGAIDRLERPVEKAHLT
jgi:hypothetical protein